MVGFKFYHRGIFIVRATEDNVFSIECYFQ